MIGVGKGTCGRWLCIGLLGAAATSATADGTAWLPEPGSGYASLSLVHQSADEFYRADRLLPTPQSADLDQSTVWLNANYALADGWSVDVQTGWARSRFVTGPGIPATESGFSGRTDTSVGITRRLTDEATGPLPSTAIRLGGIAAGDYRTGEINALGDGGNGYEVSAIAGRFLAGARLGLSGELGYRSRDSGIPEETFANIVAYWLVSDVVTLGVDYRFVDSRDGFDIGGPGFTPARFPELEEDRESLGLRIYVNVGSVGLSAFSSRVVDGRNTAGSHVFGLVVSRSFGSF